MRPVPNRAFMNQHPPRGQYGPSPCITETNSDYSIQTWALEEARRRLEAEGILEDPEKAKN
jgi:hypothetical protein